MTYKHVGYVVALNNSQDTLHADFFGLPQSRDALPQCQQENCVVKDCGTEEDDDVRIA